MDLYGSVTRLPYSVFLFPGTQVPPVRPNPNEGSFWPEVLQTKSGQIVVFARHRISHFNCLLAFCLDLTDLLTCCSLPCAGHVSLSVGRASNARLTPIYLQLCTHLIVFLFLLPLLYRSFGLFGLLVRTSSSSSYGSQLQGSQRGLRV